MKLYCYPKCSTCKKATAFLDSHGIDYEYVNIKENPPSATELGIIHEKSQLPIKKLFNTSGNSYRNANMKEHVGIWPIEKLLEALAGDGMMIKRPLLVDQNFVLIGFKDETWQTTLGV